MAFGALFESINARLRKENQIMLGPGVSGKPKGSRPPPIDFYFVSYHSQSERNRYQTVTLDRQSIAFQEKRVCPFFLMSLSNNEIALGAVNICQFSCLSAVPLWHSLFFDRPCNFGEKLFFKGYARLARIDWVVALSENQFLWGRSSDLESNLVGVTCL